MRILQVNPFFASCHGGSARSPYNIAQELCKKGHDVTFFTSDYKVSDKWITESLAKVYPYKTVLRKSNFIITPTIIPAAKVSIKYADIIHLHNYRTFQNVVVSYYAIKNNIPYILEAHGSLPFLIGDKKFKKFFDRYYGLKMISKSSGVIAVSEMEADQYVKLGVPHEKVSIIPLGLDLSEFKSLPARGHFRSKYKINNADKLLLYLGRIHPIKGIHYLINAFDSLLRQNPKFKLAIVGPDDGYMQELTELVGALGIGHSVLFLGPLYGKEKIEAYTDADLFVLPSLYEIFGLAVLESVACGTPVLITNRCGLDSNLNGKVGLSVRSNSSYALKEGILELFANQDKYLEYKKNCKEIINKFSVADQAVALAALYQKISRK